MVGSSTGSRLDRTSGCCVVVSVARLVTGHRIELHVTLKASTRDDTTPTLPHNYATQRRKQKDDLTDKTLKSAQKPEEIDGETWYLGIRIEIRWLRKPLKVDGTPGRIVNSMQMEMSLAKAPNKMCFYKDLPFQ